MDGRGLLIGSPIQEIEKEAEGIAGMNLEGKTIVAALHLRCSRKRMTRVKKRHIVEALASEQYLSLQQEIESRTDFASPLHPEPSHQRRMPTCTSHFDIRQRSRKDWIQVPLKIGHLVLPRSMPNIAFLDLPKSKLNSDFADRPVKYSSRRMGKSSPQSRDPRCPSKGLLLALPEGLELGVPFYVLSYILLVRACPGPDPAMTH